MKVNDTAPEFCKREQVHYVIGDRVIECDAIIIAYFYNEAKQMYRYLIRVFREGDKLLMRPTYIEKYEDQLIKFKASDERKEESKSYQRNG